MHIELTVLEVNKVLERLVKHSQTTLAMTQMMAMKPLTDHEAVAFALEQTEEARKHIVFRGTPSFQGITDAYSLFKRAHLGSTLTLSECIAVIKIIAASHHTLAYVEDLRQEKIPTRFLDPLYQAFIPLHDLYKELTFAIDERTETLFDHASMDLQKIRKQLVSAENKLRTTMQEIMQNKASMLTDMRIVLRRDRLCLPVKVEYKNTFKGIIHDESASGTTVYIEPQVAVTISQSIQSLQHKESEEITKILSLLSASIGLHADALKTNLNTIVALDILYGKAKYAISIDATKPYVNDEGVIDLLKARHPLIEPDEVVPIDVKIGEGHRTILITGPNTGGKTVALKTVGLLTAMAQLGCLIPAKAGSTIAVFENIFVDIGDEQSIEQSLSTFSSHMKKIIHIVNNITSKSLVLLDEVGSGTDPKEGSSIAMALLEYLHSKDARIIVTTHYSELKAFAYDQDDMINASVEFDEKTLAPTYRLLLGVPGRSNALSIAKRLGLRQDIIDLAESKNTTTQTDVAVLIKKLEDQGLQLERKSIEYSSKIEEYDRLSDLARKKISEIDKSKENEKIQARKQAEAIIDKAKEDAQSLIKKIESKSKDTLKLHDIAALKYEARNVTVTEEPLGKKVKKTFQEGDTVFVIPYQKEGFIVSKKKSVYLVQMGPFKMDFSSEDLEARETKVVKKPTKRKPVVTTSVAREGTMTLDLRGFRFDDAKTEIDRFIDKAILNRFQTIRIIHGYGTGAIKKAVWDYLKQSTDVESFRYGGDGEGLMGATIVTLK